MGGTAVLMGTPSLENMAAMAVLKAPRLLRSISTSRSLFWRLPKPPVHQTCSEVPTYFGTHCPVLME